jgi:ankyrin repeat protein
LKASINGHLKIVKLGIENEADVTANNNEAICWASEKGHLETVKLLLKHGATAPNKQTLNYLKSECLVA